MLADRLRSLRAAKFQIKLITERGFRLPVYKGGVFRGGFGQYFREISCTTKLKTCGGCREAGRCGYSRVFETPVNAAEAPLLKKYPNAPHPFVLTPPLDTRQVLESGTELTLDLVLIEPAWVWFPHFLFVFDRMGREGRYGGPYRLAGATGADGRLLFEGNSGQILEAPAEVEWDLGERKAERIQIEFLTPLRIRTNGAYNTNPSFVEFIHGLLGRLHLLTALYGGQSPDRRWMKELLALADQTRTEGRNLRLYEWDRMSGRQQRRIPGDGVVGQMVVSGEMGRFLPVLRAGELLHAGSGTSMGLGKFRVWVEG